MSGYLQKLRSINRDVRLYLLTATLTGFFSEGIRAVLFNLYLLRLGYGPGFIGSVNAVAALSFSGFCLPAGVLGRRWNSRRLMVIGVVLMVLGHGLLLLVEFAPTTWQVGWLSATLILAFFGQALYFVHGTPFLMNATGSEERNYAFSLGIALRPLAGFVGSLIGGVLPAIFATALNVSQKDPATYRYSLLLGVLLLIPAVPALFAVRKPHVRQARARVVKSGRAPYGLIAFMALVVMCRLAGWGAVNTFFNVYLDTEFYTSTTMIGALTAVGKLLSVPAALITPLLVARWGNGRTIVLGSLGIALSTLPLAFIPHWAAAGLGFIGVSVLFSMTTAPVRVYGQELVSPNWRSAMSGAIMMGAGLSLSGMALGGGYVIPALGYRGLFLTGFGLTVAGILLFWIYFRVPRGELASPPAPDLT